MGNINTFQPHLRLPNKSQGFRFQSVTVLVNTSITKSLFIVLSKCLLLVQFCLAHVFSPDFHKARVIARKIRYIYCPIVACSSKLLLFWICSIPIRLKLCKWWGSLLKCLLRLHSNGYFVCLFVGNHWGFMVLISDSEISAGKSNVFHFILQQQAWNTQIKWHIHFQCEKLKTLSTWCILSGFATYSTSNSKDEFLVDQTKIWCIIVHVLSRIAQWMYRIY